MTAHNGLQMRIWIYRILCSSGMALLAMTTPAMAEGSQAAPRGSLVIMGGAVRPDNVDIWRRLVELTGKPKPRFAIIAAAAGDPVVSAKRISDALGSYGAESFLVPIAPRLKDTDFRKNAQDVELAQTITAADGVFFTGGDQSRITAALRTADGKSTRALDAVWAVYRRGGVIAGTSAGAAIMSSTMFYEPPGVLSVLQHGVKQGSDIAAGLGFLSAPVFVDQHLLARGRFARMISVMHTAKYHYGLGVDENTAVVVLADGTAEVVGASGVIVADLSKASIAQTPAGLRATDVRLSYLERGDRINLKDMAVTASAFKRDGRVLDPKDKAYKPEFDEPRFYADVLGKNVLVEVLTNLIDNTAKEVVGLAFAAPDAKAAAGASGFEFRFRKGQDTRGHLRIEQGVAHYTVLAVEMDVLPVQMAAPLYRLE